MSSVKYTIQKELKTPWIGKPYIQYQLVKHWSEFVMDWPDNWGDDRNFQRIIFKSEDEALVNKFLEKLNEQNSLS